MNENNDNERPCPTGPGWWYRELGRGMPEIVWVRIWNDSLAFFWAGSDSPNDIKDDGRWLGRVPMPGEWAPRKLFEAVRYELGASVTPRIQAQSVWLEAREWSEANPEPKDKP